jgi:hypothetical protein
VEVQYKTNGDFVAQVVKDGITLIKKQMEDQNHEQRIEGVNFAGEGDEILIGCQKNTKNSFFFSG